MKATKTVEKSFCDFCGKEASGYAVCQRCGKDFCYDCRKTEGVEYKHAVHFSGSDDGLYCGDCDNILLAKKDELHTAYRKIKQLRVEESSWYVDFKARYTLAESNLKRLIKKAGR